jgi:hypothetical protein
VILNVRSGRREQRTMLYSCYNILSNDAKIEQNMAKAFSRGKGRKTSTMLGAFKYQRFAIAVAEQGYQDAGHQEASTVPPYRPKHTS